MFANHSPIPHVAAMSVQELAVEKVKQLNDQQTRELLKWLDANSTNTSAPRQPKGAMAVLGCARKIWPEARTTAEWMTMLREGERE